MKKSFKGSALLAPLPVVMVSCGSKEKNNENIITIGWTGIINSSPAITYVSIRPERYSHDIIEESGEFVINLTTGALAKETDFCGVKSGRDLDKFKEMGLTKEYGEEVSCPMIVESPVNLECKVIGKQTFNTHDMYMAEIVKVHVDETYIDDKGKFNLDKARLLSYIHGEYFTTSKLALGKFGYSIMKPKTKKRLNKTAHEERIAKNKEKREKNKNLELDKSAKYKDRTYKVNKPTKAAYSHSVREDRREAGNYKSSKPEGRGYRSDRKENRDYKSGKPEGRGYRSDRREARDYKFGKPEGRPYKSNEYEEKDYRPKKPVGRPFKLDGSVGKVSRISKSDNKF